MALPLTPQPAPTADAPIRQLRLEAALRGEFDPAELVRSVVGNVTPALLEKLSVDCIDRSSEDRTLWVFKPDARRTVLASAPGEVNAALTHLEDDPSDLFGSLLRASLRGDEIDVRGLSGQELDELHTAVQFSSAVRPDTSGSGSMDVEIELTRRDADEALDFVKPTRLIGREKAMETLHRFLKADLEPGPRSPTFVLVDGTGGTGKSALLSTFASDVRGQNWEGPPIIWFDFDRALLARADPITMMLEFTRQLALVKRFDTERLREFRRDIRRRLGSNADVSDFESRASLQSEIWSRWQSDAAEILPVEEPVLIIFDTFEEVLLRDASEVRQIVRWIDTLVFEGQIFHVKPIFAGRALIGTNANPEFKARLFDTIELRDLDLQPAAQLLRLRLGDAGVDPGAFPIEQLVERFGGNPLLIKLLATFCAEAGPEEANSALTDAGSAKFRKNFAQSFLYRRIVSRLRTTDPTVTRVASPGLTLRRVTPDLIRQVLAEPCGLGKISKKRSESIFDLLAGQIWLVDRVGGQRAVRHRRDLRRLMLQTMEATETEAVAEIHRGAQRYYARRSDPQLSDIEQWVEEQYHALFTSKVRLTPDEASRLAQRLGQDIDDIPLAARAHLKFLAGRTLDEAEFGSLTESERRTIISDRRKTARSHGEAFPTSPSAPNAPDFVNLELDVAVQFEELRFDRLSLLVPLAVSALMPPLLQNDAPKLPMTMSPLWQIAIAALIDPVVRQTLVVALDDEHLKNARRKQLRLRPDRMRIGDWFDAVERLIDLDVSSQSATETFERATIETLDELRCWQLVRLHGASKIGIPRRVRTSLLVYLAEPELGILRNHPLGVGFANLFEGGAPSLAQIKELENQRPYIELTMMSSGEIDRLMRGRSTEFYPLARSLLSECTDSQIVDVVAKLARGSTLWPSELESGRQLPQLARDRARWLSTIVETADLTGRFEKLLRFSSNPQIIEKGNTLSAMWQAFAHRVQPAHLNLL